MAEDEWRFIVDINLTEAFQGCGALGPHFLARRRGAVVNISGWASFRGRDRSVGAPLEGLGEENHAPADGLHDGSTLA